MKKNGAPPAQKKKAAKTAKRKPGSSRCFKLSKTLSEQRILLAQINQLNTQIERLSEQRAGSQRGYDRVTGQLDILAPEALPAEMKIQEAYDSNYGDLKNQTDHFVQEHNKKTVREEKRAARQTAG